jgi:pimeloyl-ACP methyl ester carboxylesterase
MKLDALGSMMMLFTLDASPMVRTPQLAARALTTPGAIFTPEELHARLNGESAMVTFQQSPPLWYPPENIKTPMLLLAGEKDAVVPLEPLRRSAAHYKADFVLVPEAGHNLMMEKSYQQTARTILDWLEKKQIA